MKNTATPDLHICTAPAKSCRTCKHRPRHWARWQSAAGVWHDGKCQKTRQMVRPENRCEKWSGWAEEAGRDD